MKKLHHDFCYVVWFYGAYCDQEARLFVKILKRAGIQAFYHHKRNTEDIAVWWDIGDHHHPPEFKSNWTN
jgi:hypothetical protein